MTKLHDALEDLTTGVPSYVEVDAPAAWRAGRRRRRRRYAVSAAFGLVVAALLASSFLLPRVDRTAPADIDGRVGVTGFPTRIGHQWFRSDMPTRPGPLAGIVQREDGWYALSPSGKQWRLVEDRQDIWPALSPDGTVVVFLDQEAGDLVIHDLVTGEVRRLPQFRTAGMPIEGDWFIYSQTPHFWSPDGRRLLLGSSSGISGEDETVRPVVDVRSGAVTTARIGYWIAGWYDNESLLRVRTPNRNTVRVHVVGLDGVRLRKIDLTTAEPLVEKFLGQWGPVFSATTGELLVVSAKSQVEQAHRLPITTPRPATVTSVYETDTPCSHGWAAASPYVSTDGEAPTVLVTEDGLRPMVTVEDSEEIRCIVWARDAISGTPNDSVFGSSTAWWTWWWRELSLGAALLVGVVGLGLWLRRRRHP